MECPIAVAVPTPKVFEQRTFRRFALVVPVLFRWSDEKEHCEVGVCRSVGLGGIFVQTMKPPAVGAAIRLEMVMKGAAPNFGEVLLTLAGRVVRVENGNRLSGFAAAGHFEDEISRSS